MKTISNSNLRLAASCLLFDSSKFHSLLLIKEKKAPFKWCFPGGKIEPDESLIVGMERETFEETGYPIKVVPGSLFNVVEYQETEYLIITGMAFLENLKTTNVGRPERDLVIQQKVFSLLHQDPNNLWKTDDSEFIPGLKDIVQKFISSYKDKY